MSTASAPTLTFTKARGARKVKNNIATGLVTLAFGLALIPLVWLLWTVLRAEIAVAFADRVQGARLHADLLPWAGSFAGLSSGSITLGPVDLALADLATLLGRPAAEREAHLHTAARIAREIGAIHWERRALDALRT